MTKRQAHYQVGDIIGNTQNQFRVYQVHMGGMGEVYLCLHQESKIPIALKTFQSADIRMKKLFEDETRTWIELGKHQNIVRCHWMNVFNNTPFMGLDWILGKEGYGADLRSWLRKGGISLKQSLKFSIDIVRGLVYANEKSPGIVHRDLKPDNVLVARGDIAKITDFGLATIIQKSDLATITEDKLNEESSHQSIRQGNIVGTPAYMSPEQWQGDIDIDSRADIYAVGCILYEMLTGRMPYVANSIRKLHLQHLEAPIPKVKDVPAEVNIIISKCLSKNRNDRYLTTQALLDALIEIYYSHTGETLYVVQDGEMDELDYINRGLTYHNLGEYDLAIADYNIALKYNSNSFQAYYNLGVSYQKKEFYDIAITHYNTVIHLNPNVHDSAEVYNNRGLCYASKNQIDYAIADFDMAIHLNPNFAEAYVNRGVSYSSKGMIDRAITDYTTAIRLNTKLVAAYINRGLCYDRKSMIDHALADYDTAIQLDPNLTTIYFNRGNIYRNKGMIDRAVADYDTAIRLNSNHAEIYNNRGLCYARKGMIDRAITDYDTAIRLNSNYSDPWLNKGSIYGGAMRLQEALAYFERAYQLGDSKVMEQIQQTKQMINMMVFQPAQSEIEILFEAFAKTLSSNEMRQTVEKYPKLKEIIQDIRQIIQTELPPYVKPEFEIRLAWLIQIVKGE